MKFYAHGDLQRLGAVENGDEQYQPQLGQNTKERCVASFSRPLKMVEWQNHIIMPGL